MAERVKRIVKVWIFSREERCFSQPFLRVSMIFKHVPPAANPKSVMLMTINDRWFHWLMEKALTRSISKDRAESDNRNTAVSIMSVMVKGISGHGYKQNTGNLFNGIVFTLFCDKGQTLVAEWVPKGKNESSTVFKLF